MRSLLSAGMLRTSGTTAPVTDPFTGERIDEVSVASSSDIDQTLDSAVAAFERTRRMSAGERAAVLSAAAAGIVSRREELIDLIVSEGGKPWKYSASEVDRAAVTMTWSAEEAKRVTGDIMRLDTQEAGRLGITRRFPLGVVLGITPFNFPLNLVCHKVGPALAAGNAIVVKPAPATPLSSLNLGEILVEAGAADAISVLPASNDDAQAMVVDPRVAMVTFTGSTAVGWRLRGLVPSKRVTLELGGNAPAIVEPDADLERAAARIAFGGFYQAGQSCVAVQRILVHREIERAFLEQLIPKVNALRTGDPRDRATDVGPMIDRGALDRVAAWVDEAVAGGAEVLTGGVREGPCYLPTVLTKVTPDMKVSCEEVFGPVVTVQSYAHLDEAIEIANDSPYGLQAGLFTNDVRKVFHAHRELRVGGLIHDDVSAWRADQMPYGGVKASGEGREGPASAIAEMTEERLLVLGGLDL